MRIGRILKQGDILFDDSSKPSTVSTGGVILSRQATDDYVRFRVPDTNCPPLPQPAFPLDSGIADEAEPGRWLTNLPEQRTTNGWEVRWNEYVQLSYTLLQTYSFRVHTFSVGAASLPGVGAGQSYIVGVGVEVRIGSKWVKYLYAIATAWLAPRYAYFWVVKDNGSAQSYPIQDSTSGQVLPGGRDVWIDVTVNAGVANATLWYRDSDGVMKQATFAPGQNAQHDLQSTNPFQIRITGHGNSSGGASVPDMQMQFTAIATLSGAPASVTVITPVVDLLQPVNATPSRYPALGTLEWRAGNTAFSAGDTNPPWNNPQGEYRYWQARVTWTIPSQLLERIEFAGGAVIARVQYSGMGWLLHHREVSSPYMPVERPVGGVPRSVRLQGDSVLWQGEDDEYITTRDA